MKKILIISISLLGLALAKLVFAQRLCIELNNLSLTTVEFAGVPDPGYAYTVLPNGKVILSGDHMVGACLGTNNCTVSIFPLDGKSASTSINHIVPGTRIIYGAPNQYYLDVNAQVLCETN